MKQMADRVILIQEDDHLHQIVVLSSKESQQTLYMYPFLTIVSGTFVCFTFIIF